MRDLKEDEYFVNLKKYIENISEESRADEKIYEERLLLCKQCDNLISGMCVKCGCFVELRAAIKDGYCPGIEKKW